MNELALITQYAEKICAAWRRSAESIIETGKLLTEAKAKLSHGTWLTLINQSKLPFKARVAQCLMEIARDHRFINPQTIALLPAEWSTIHSLSKIKDDDAFNAALTDEAFSGSKARQQIKTAARDQRERELADKQQKLPTQKFGVIVADPEWRFEPWSRTTGMDRAADNHYSTSALEVIKARDVASIAADDCILFLWATVPMLPQAIEVMGAWGFDYKSACTWHKDKIGTGYWFRNMSEHLLLGTRGNIPAPAMGTQWKSIVEAPATRHSAKPEIFLQMIESYFPTLPKIELNRRGPARKGWAAWGNEAEPESADDTGQTSLWQWETGGHDHGTKPALLEKTDTR